MNDLLALALLGAGPRRARLPLARVLSLSDALLRRARRGRRHPTLGSGEIAWIIRVLAPEALPKNGFDPQNDSHIDGLRRACAAVLHHRSGKEP